MTRSEQHYSDPSREKELHALPNLELWQSVVWNVTCDHACGEFQLSENYIQVEGWVGPESKVICPDCGHNSGAPAASDKKGWFYWFCFPDCMPDSEEHGPFDTREEALENARDE